MKKILLIVLAATVMIGAMGCSNRQEKVGIRGQVTKVVVNANKVVSSILVEGKVESDTLHDKALVGITKETSIVKGNTNQKLTAEDVKEGMKVEVVFEGPAAESYPVQGKAKTLRVID